MDDSNVKQVKSHMRKPWHAYEKETLREKQNLFW